METSDTTTTTRRLGRSSIEVSALGLGCWAIGGPFTLDGTPDGWGAVDDDESVRAIHRALDLGVTFFDTADAYGAGHSERVLGRALTGRRDQVVIATKFGFGYDERRRDVSGTDISPAYARRACEASLRRLGTDYIDLYQLHVGGQSEAESLAVRDALEDLVAAGKIRAYGWSTADPANVRLFAAGEHCTAVQHGLNVLSDAPEMLAVAREHDLASICNSPLNSGILTGKFHGNPPPLPADDVRAQDFAWQLSFSGGRARPELLAQVDAVREILTSDGRSLAQGALAWIWARGDHTVPIPGFKTVAQVEENAGALEFGPLRPHQMAEIEAILCPR